MHCVRCRLQPRHQKVLAPRRMQQDLHDVKLKIRKNPTSANIWTLVLWLASFQYHKSCCNEGNFSDGPRCCRECGSCCSWGGCGSYGSCRSASIISFSVEKPRLSDGWSLSKQPAIQGFMIQLWLQPRSWHSFLNRSQGSSGLCSVSVSGPNDFTSNLKLVTSSTSNELCFSQQDMSTCSFWICSPKVLFFPDQHAHKVWTPGASPRLPARRPPRRRRSKASWAARPRRWPPTRPQRRWPGGWRRQARFDKNWNRLKQIMKFFQGHCFLGKNEVQNL